MLMSSSNIEISG